MTDDITTTLTSFVTTFFRDGEGGTNSVLDYLDQDPSWDAVEQLIGSLSEIGDNVRWAIGEILLFLRYRDSHHTVATFGWDVGDVWPMELFQFVKDRYGVSISTDESETVEFLAWVSYQYEKFWLLVRPGQIKVWEKGHGAGLDDDTLFEQYLRQMAARLHSVLDENTLQNYYYTVACWPRSKRHPHLKWTIHYEATNLAGSQVEDSLRGLKRLEAKAPIAQQIIDRYEDDGGATTTKLRHEQRRNQQRKQGYIFQLPDIPHLSVIDTETGEIHVAIEFHDQRVARTALYYANLTRDYPDERLDLIWEGNSLKLDGEVVATLPNSEEPAVAGALLALSTKMRWRVKR